MLIALVASKRSTEGNKPEWAKKDIRDYSEADLERLLDQWEVSSCYDKHMQLSIFIHL